MTIKDWVEDQREEYAKWKNGGDFYYFDGAIDFCEYMSRKGGVELTLGRANRILNALERDYNAVAVVA